MNPFLRCLPLAALTLASLCGDARAWSDPGQSITPEMKTRWTASEPRDWANESFAIAEAVKTGYCAMLGDSCNMPGSSVTISLEYLEANQPVVKEQLQKAGVRLARVLDTAFGN